MNELLKPPEIGDLTPYEYILEMCRSNDGLRLYLQKPFIVGDFVIATDGVKLVYFDKKLVAGTYGSANPSNFKIVMDIINKARNENAIIKTSFLYEGLSAFDVVDDYDEDEEENECKECGGTGMVEWSYNDYDKIFEPLQKGRIKKSTFAAANLLVLLNITRVLNTDEITLVSQVSEADASIFKIGDIHFVMMLMSRSDDENVKLILL